MFWLILFQLVLIFLNAVFASAEIAVLSMNEAVLAKRAEDGDKRAKRLAKLTKEPAKFLATIQVAITLSGFLGSAFAADNFAEPLAKWVISLGVQMPEPVLQTMAVILITLILSYFTLVFGELVPKRLAMKKAEGIAMGISGVVTGISVVFKPIVAFLSLSTNLVLRLFGIDPNAADDEVDEEEILLMVDAGSETGAIETHEKELIQNIFDFNDTVLSDFMTRRGSVVYLRAEDTDEQWWETIKQSKFTRYPICEGEDGIDNIIGVLNTKDYFRLDNKSRKNVMNEAVGEAYFVPENITADVLFGNMKAEHNSFAVVIDEYGSMSGIVTLSDIIEELVGETGEAEDDGSEPKERIVALEDGSFEVFGNVELEEVEEAMGVSFGDECEFGTISGIVFDTLGSIPQDGECDITVELEKITVNIKRVDSHCIDSAILTLRAPEEDSEDKSDKTDSEED